MSKNSIYIDSSRRSFLKKSVLAGIAGSSLCSPLGGINGIYGALNNSASLKAAPGYRALVCIFLQGGNDSFNMVVPNDENGYGIYQTSRQNLAIPQEELLPITPVSGGTFGFHPSMGEIQALFESGQLAIQSNVGTLVEPVTREQILNKTANLPAQLFSHNSQQALWQAGSADGDGNLGWGGEIADLVNAQNNSTVSMNISIAGNNLFQVGNSVFPYSMNAAGTEAMYGVRDYVQWEQSRAAAFQNLRDLSSTHLFETKHGNAIRNTQETSALLTAALETAPILDTVFPEGNNLAEQLQMVAKMISISEDLGFQRQIFFVAMGGFDTHDRQVEDQPQLLSSLSQAMDSFNTATVELGVVDQVTSFTLSDFGRTLTSNGDGTDHGWGSHQMVMGGAVNGRDIYGTMPELSIGGPDDAKDGRMIPTTSVDQYTATIARWFGLSEQELTQVFPNLGNFASADMGFMNV